LGQVEARRPEVAFAGRNFRFSAIDLAQHEVDRANESDYDSGNRRHQMEPSDFIAVYRLVTGETEERECRTILPA
jgi:hypothetical protein